MRQVIQEFRSGAISVPDVPAPVCQAGTVLVRTRASLISAGTEAAVLRFSQQNLLQKAISRPDLAKQVVEKVRSQGFRSAYDLMQSRLDVPLPLGYSSAGDVFEVGSGVSGIRPGQRVACSGGGCASHAQIVAVPKLLVTPLPDGVDYSDAAFATVGAVALQGLRIADVRVGERVVVIGLGLIGLLSVQLLRAAGCFVLGTDPSNERVALALELGANEGCRTDPDSVKPAVDRFTRGRGADAVIIAAATKSNDPIELAGQIARLKGRVVVVGDVGMNIPRRTYYEKELELHTSRSYGPGRYDPDYEEKGIDYPYAYVPFTEQRNIETFVQLVGQGDITPSRLITHRFSIDEADKAYAIINGDVSEPHLGVLFTYPEETRVDRKVPMPSASPVEPSCEADVRLGVIGAGNYSRLMLLPKLKEMKDIRRSVVSTARGLNAWDAAKRFGFEHAASGSEEILQDDQVNAIIIATRHDSHAGLVQAALRAGKHVFVEKPLATTERDLHSIVAAAEQSKRHLMVGFNRRFAPLVQKAVEMLRGRTHPLAIMYRVNAGALPSGHWTQDSTAGGGRIIGEVCHFVDLMQHLCGCPPVSVFATSVADKGSSMPVEDVLTATVRFADGSIGTVHYFANGDKAVPKEYMEWHCAGKTFILEDFRRARYAEGGKVAQWKTAGQDKGQGQELKAFVAAIKSGGPTPVPLDEAVWSTLTTFRVLDSLRTGTEVPVVWRVADGPGTEPPVQRA